MTAQTPEPDLSGAIEKISVTVPAALHPDTKNLVGRFAEEVALKLRSAEEKYGYSDGWLTEEWEAECRQHLYEHAAKGDPRDVAIYCAFMWSRGWSTACPSPADDRLGVWLSAALDDPNVCAEMKADINAWFAARPTTGERT